MIKRTVLEHCAALDRGEYSAVDLTRAYLDEIARIDPTVGAFLTLDAENALTCAKKSDERRKNGEKRGILDGIPYALKDNFCTKGLRTTCASRMLADFVPPYDSAVARRLRGAGAILLGKTNLDEFAMGSTTETSALGVTRNPIDPSRVAGGSSGGSAAAVAAMEAAFAVGSDTGGSVRQPAAFCGTVGLKPTYGAISRYGMLALASSLDTVGILSRTVGDCEAVFSALVGLDPGDVTSYEAAEFDVESPLASSARPLRVAIVRELIDGAAVEAEAVQATLRALDAFRDMGAEIGEVSLPAPDAALAAYCVISAAESSSNLARYDGVSYGRRTAEGVDLQTLYEKSRAEGFGSEVKRRILFGTYMLSEEKRALYYDRARRARAAVAEEMDGIFDTYDVILTPTTPTSAIPLGYGLTPAQSRRADLCAVYANLSGCPAISIPFGRDASGMPIGVQLMARRFADRALLRVAERLLEVVT